MPESAGTISKKTPLGGRKRGTEPLQISQLKVMSPPVIHRGGNCLISKKMRPRGSYTTNGCRRAEKGGGVRKTPIYRGSVIINSHTPHY